MQALAAGKGCVDERAGQVQAPAGDLEHAFDQVTDLGRFEDRGGQLGLAVAGDEHLVRSVDPDLLDRRVVEVGLERAEAAERVFQGLSGAGAVDQRWRMAAQGAVVVVVQRLADQVPQTGAVAHRVDAASSDQLAHLVLELGSRVHAPSPCASNGGGSAPWITCRRA